MSSICCCVKLATAEGERLPAKSLDLQPEWALRHTLCLLPSCCANSSCFALSSTALCVWDDMFGVHALDTERTSLGTLFRPARISRARTHESCGKSEWQGPRPESWPPTSTS